MYDLILIYKIINNLSDLNFLDFFSYRSIKYNLRGNSTKIDTTFKHNSDEWRSSFFSRAVRYWNSLPDSIASSSSLQIFKTKIKTIDLDILTK